MPQSRPRERDPPEAGGAPDEASIADSPGEVYRLLVESVRDYAIFALDPTGRVRSWNLGAQLLKGYRADEIVGKHFSVFYGDEDVARGKPAQELRIAEQFGRFEDEGWRIRRDGSRFWANVIITAMRRGDGVLVGFGKVTRDLTERRQAEEWMRLSEERFRLLVEGVSEYAIIFLDPQGVIQSWNPGAVRLTGYRPIEIIGEHFGKLYPVEDAAAGRPQRELEIAAREGRYEEEGWRVKRDGSRFWVNVVVTALRDPRDGHLIGYSKITRDLSERKRRDEALRHAYKDMEAFSYSVSHDLRAPLRAMHSLADLTLRDDAGLVGEARENIEALRTSAERAIRLVDGLLNLARAAQGDIRMESVELREVIARVAASLSQRVSSKVEARFPPDALWVKGDVRLLEIVVENLLANAWKFTTKVAAPRVDVMREDDDEHGRVVFSVRDNGPGFDPKRAGELFQPFRRLHTEAEFAGTGVGLATVGRVVERHGGAVWARSKPGEGAAFFVALPPASDE